MKILTSLLALLFAATLHAEADSLVIANYKPAESSVTISVPAQYLSAEIRIESDEDDWALKLSNIEDARRMLTAAAEKEGYKVRIDQALIFGANYNKFSFSSSRGNQEPLSDILLLAPITDSTNLVQVVKKYKAIISETKPAKKIRVSLGNIALALENPEALRNDLLKKIRIHVETSAKLLSDIPDYTISGLDEPLRIRQKGERQLELFLPFRVIYSQRK